MLIFISLKNIEKMFFITECSYVDFKIGSKVIKCNNRSIFTKLCFFFSLVQQQDAFKTLNRVEVFQKDLIYMFIIKGTPFEASFYGFYKDKHRKFWAILTEILQQLG